MTEWEIYFWEPSISPHKLDLFQALAHSPTVAAAYYVAQDGLSASRKAEGWSLPDIRGTNVIVGPTRNKIADIIRSSSPTSVHLFSGIHWVPCIVHGIDAAIMTGRRFGLMSEPRAFEGVQGFARFAHSWLTEGRVRRHSDFVLAIGRNGPPWFQLVGYDRSQIFPFAYFLPSITMLPTSHTMAARERGIRLTFLGRLAREKGIHLFLDALPRIRSKVTAGVAGIGPDVNLVRSVASNSAVPLTYYGPIPMEGVPQLLRETDILVLPSITIDDGWGAVVSEALMAGAAVVTTDKVGASICLDDDSRGRVIRQLTAEAVAAAIDWVVNNGRLTQAYRAKRSVWANAHLTGKAGSQYLLSILNHVYSNGKRPVPFYAQ